MKILVTILGLACVSVLAYAMLGSDGAPSLGSPGAPSPSSVADGDRAARPDMLQANAPSVRRQTAELDEEWTDAPEVELAAADARISIRGRVVDALGNAVPDAEVAVLHRRDFRALFENGGSGFDFGAMRDFGRGGRDRMRDMFSPKELGEPIRTGSDGSFAVDGSTFAQSSLWVVARHSQLAPGFVQRDWDPNQGNLDVGAIALEPGVLIRGRVIDDLNGPVPGAVVEYQADGGGRGGRGGGRGGPFGGGRGGPFGGGAPADLVRDAVAGADGSFAIGPVPYGAAQLSADAERHLAARSDTVQIDERTAPPTLELLLRRAGQIRGVVRDAAGQPVADARVSAAVYVAPDAEQNDRGGRGGPRGGRGRGGRGGEAVTTDENGEFALTELEPGLNTLRVNHESYLDYESEQPIATGPEAFAEVGLSLAPYLDGIVVDARTGEQVTNFGIRARRNRGTGNFGDFANRGNRGRRGQEQDPAAEAERATNAALQEQMRTSLLGASGQTPGRTPAPEDQGTGQFRLEGLDPGSILVDVSAPGYVATAFGPFEIDPERPSAPLTLRLDRGTVVVGQILDHRNAPVPGARVSVELPPVGNQNDNNPLGQIFGRGGRGGRGGFGGRALARATADAEGWFELTPLRPGGYRIVVEAEDQQTLEQDDFVVSDRGEQSVVLHLFRGATVRGRVLADSLEGMRVELRHVDGDRQTARVDPADGTYEIRGLRPGGYYAAAVGRSGESRRAAMTQMLSQGANGSPDFVLADGTEIHHDLLAIDDALGRLEGSVTLHGRPGENLSVRLTPQPSGVGPTGDEGNDFVNRMTSRLLTARVDAETGKYDLANIPPGAYHFEVLAGSGGGGRGGRGGFGGGRVIHTEPVTITARITSQLHANATPASVSFAVALPIEAENPRARIVLVPTEAVGDTPTNEWRRLPGAESVSILEDGTTGTVYINEGAWSYVVQGRGVASAAGQVQIGTGGNAPIQIQTTYDAESAAAPRGPGGGNGGGNGPAGGRGPGAATGRGGGGGRGAGGRGRGN